MGKSILNTVIDLLNDGGIPAAPAQPEEHMMIIHTPVAAVSIEKVDTAEGVVSVLVEVVGPIQSGAERCQKRALTVCNILSAAGAACVQGGCAFHGGPALFRVPVTAQFYGTATADDWIPKEETPAFSYKLGDTALEYVKSFSASQTVDEDHETLTNAPWEFVLEEFFPIGTEEPEKPTEPFALFIENEIFAGCTLTQWRRVHTAQGIEQVRKGTATSRKVE